MPVAKTYASMEIEGEPFKENGRMYINVRAKSGIKKVRWYSDAEYKRMYPEEEVKHDIMDFNARHAFGFGDLGFITIYKGNQTSLEDCAEAHHNCFRRNLTFGYYTPSRLDICDLPSDVVPVTLTWSEVMAHDDRMKPHEEVMKIVAGKLGMNTTSEYQGNKGDWIEKEITVRENKTHETQYGDKHTMVMVDAEGNAFIWETGTKNFECGTQIVLRMKVKEHKEIKGEKCTVVWYCKEK